jgi:hypothetical protein
VTAARRAEQPSRAQQRRSGSLAPSSKIDEK